jgi:hypothetical protein
MSFGDTAVFYNKRAFSSAQSMFDAFSNCVKQYFTFSSSFFLLTDISADQSPAKHPRASSLSAFPAWISLEVTVPVVIIFLQTSAAVAVSGLICVAIYEYKAKQF